MAQMAPTPELVLPSNEFVYEAGSTGRPWEQFEGRWKAIKPRLADICAACGHDRPLRVVDLGSCTGFFSLQAAYHHPEADVIGVEGSVGIGNGVVGMAGSVRQILKTRAVQTHLRWIQQLNLQNCMVAPEVWDYARVCKLAAEGRPVCDVSFMLSVVHHIDGISQEQYANAGLSKAEGTAELLAKLLSLAPNHFIELPYKPWISAAYDAYGSQRGILEAATKRSQYEWKFVGPIFNTDWFGSRDVYLLQVKSEMPPVDLKANPFLLLISDVDPELADDVEEENQNRRVPAADAPVLPPRSQARPPSTDDDLLCTAPLGGYLKDVSSAAIGSRGSPHLPNSSHLQIDPSITALIGANSMDNVEDQIGDLLQKSPKELLVAHLVLREAMDEAARTLQQMRDARYAASQASQESTSRSHAAAATRRPMVPAAVDAF